MTDNINSGVWTTVITLFNGDGSLDMGANRALAERMLALGADGIFAVCQSSEMFFLTLEEKLKLATAYREATAGKISLVVSGHTSETTAGQIEEMRAMAGAGADALVLVTNRLDPAGEGAQALISNLGRILEAMPEAEFGLYECPYPRQRLLTDEELGWCARSGRISFIKDVSCDTGIQARRAALLRSSGLKAYNANSETLLSSLLQGYQGYCGVMGNMHIDIYKWLYLNREDPRATRVSDWLTEQAKLEYPAYPMVAKYYFQQKYPGASIHTRCKDEALLTDGEKARVLALLEAERRLRRELALPDAD